MSRNRTFCLFKLYVKNEFAKKHHKPFSIELLYQLQSCRSFEIGNFDVEVRLVFNSYKKLSCAYCKVIITRVSVLALKMIESHFVQEKKLFVFHGKSFPKQFKGKNVIILYFQVQNIIYGNMGVKL